MWALTACDDEGRTAFDEQTTPQVTDTLMLPQRIFYANLL
jgi:hypothetical protein